MGISKWDLLMAQCLWRKFPTLVVTVWLLAGRLGAAEVHVAVAGNFSMSMQKISALFERSTGHKALLSFGSSGKFYAQIRHGAPFDILLSADEHIPARLEREGYGIPGSRFVYAIGRLALWRLDAVKSETRDAGKADVGVAGRVDPELLKQGRFDRLAVAEPKLAPYGAAAEEVISRLGLKAQVASKLVVGESITQAFQFVATGNADLGFVALSQVFLDGSIIRGSAWIVPEHLHAPIRQEALLLKKGKDNAAAKALLYFLKGEEAKAIIRSHGYAL